MLSTKWTSCLFVLDTAVGFDQVLSLVQGTSLILGHPVWMSMLLLLVVAGNAVQRVRDIVVSIDGISGSYLYI